MPKYIDEDGNEVVLEKTPDELLEEAKNALSEANALKESLAQKEAELTKLKDKDLNFSRLRNAKEAELSEEKKSELEILKTAASEEVARAREAIETLKTERERAKKEEEDRRRDEIVSILADDDVELAKKIRQYYDKIAPDENQSQTERAEQAYLLATNGQSKKVGLSFSSSYGVRTKTDDQTLTEAGKRLQAEWERATSAIKKYESKGANGRSFKDEVIT